MEDLVNFFTPFNTALVSMLIFLSTRIYKQGIIPFKYFSIAFSFNILYLFITYILSNIKSLEFFNKDYFSRLEISSNITLFILNILSSFFLLYVYLSFKRNKDKKSTFFGKTVTTIIIMIIIVCSAYIYFSIIEKSLIINYFEVTAKVFSLLSVLVVIQYFKSFKEKKVSITNIKVLFVGLWIYFIIHFIPLISILFKENDKYDLTLNMIGQLCAIISKGLILYGFFRIYLLKKEAEKKDETIRNEFSTILGYTFHELASPKNSLGTLLLKQKANMPSSLKTRATINRECLRNFYHIDSIIDASEMEYKWSKSDKNKDSDLTSTEPKSANINSLIEMAIFSFKRGHTIYENGSMIYTEAITFHVDYGGNCNFSCKSKARIVQIFTNLINNSHYAFDGEKGEVYVKTRINKITDDENRIIKREIIVDFEDSGPGIPENIQSRVFERGFSTKPKDNPIKGLGLAIVDDHIKEINGSITLESPVISTTLFDKTKGTKFTIKF